MAPRSELLSLRRSRHGAAIAAVMVTCALLPSRADGAPARTSENVPIPGGTTALAKALGLDAAPDRPRFVAELVRVLYDAPEGRNADVDTKLQRLTTHLDAVGRFRTALATVQTGEGGVTLAM